jgi:hypothetical protein
MESPLATVDNAFRAVTPGEIAHYQESGRVKLDSFLPRDRVDDLLAMAKDKMGEGGDRNLRPAAFSCFNPLPMRGLDDPVSGPVIAQVGRCARALMARRARCDGPFQPDGAFGRDQCNG